jgi:hypothetical protein
VRIKERSEKRVETRIYIRDIFMCVRSETILIFSLMMIITTEAAHPIYAPMQVSMLDATHTHAFFNPKPTEPMQIQSVLTQCKIYTEKGSFNTSL